MEERIHDPRTVVDEFEIRSKVTSRLYLCQSVTSKTSRYKEKVIQAVHRQHDLEVARRKGRDGQRLSDPQAEKEARLRQTKVQVQVENQTLQRLNDAMKMRKLIELEDTVERAILEAKLINEIDDTLASPHLETSQEYRDKQLVTTGRDDQPVIPEISPATAQQPIDRADLSTFNSSNVILSTIVTTDQQTTTQLVSTSVPNKGLLTNPRAATTVISSISTPLMSHESSSIPAMMNTPVAPVCM